MAQTTDNFGILINNANVYNAVDYRDYANTEFVFGDQYMSGVGISCIGGGLTMFDTGVIPAGTLSGDYDLGIYYDCPSFTNQGEQLMRFEIYEDGVLLPENVTVYSGGNLYGYDLNTVTDSLTYGLHYFVTLKAACTYQIKVKTSTSIGSKIAILDYIYFARNGENSTNWGNPVAATIGRRNVSSTDTIGDTGTKLVFEVVDGKITASSGSTITWYAGNTVSQGFTWNQPFKKIVGAFPVGGSTAVGKLGMSIYGYDIPNSTVRIDIYTIADVTMVSPFHVYILVLGYV